MVWVVLGSRTASHVHSNVARYLEDIPPQLWSDLEAEGLVRWDLP